MYSQIASKNSLRDIEISLSLHNELIHAVSKSTLSDANNRRSYKIFEELYYTLFEKIKPTFPKHNFKFKNQLYIMDSSRIEVCLNKMAWAKAAKEKGAVKIHTVLNNDGNIPSFLVLTNGLGADVTIAREKLNLPKDSIIVMDKGYQDFDWFYKMEKSGIFFVTRPKFECYDVIKKLEVTPDTGVISDEIILLTQRESKKKYPTKLRLIKYQDKTTLKEYTFVTNNFKLAARTIADIYKERWQIELFFKWIKQTLKIKKFLGTSENAVLIQIWVAMIVYLLISYLSFIYNLKFKRLEIIRIIRESLFRAVDILDVLLTLTKKKQKEEVIQLKLKL